MLPIGVFGIYLFLLQSVLQSDHPIPLPVLLALFIGLKMLIDVSVTMINEVFLPPGIKEYINDVSQLRLQGKNVDPKCGNTSSRCGPNSLAYYTSL